MTVWANHISLLLLLLLRGDQEEVPSFMCVCVCLLLVRRIGHAGGAAHLLTAGGVKWFLSLMYKAKLRGWERERCCRRLVFVTVDSGTIAILHGAYKAERENDDDGKHKTISDSKYWSPFVSPFPPFSFCSGSCCVLFRCGNRTASSSFFFSYFIPFQTVATLWLFVIDTALLPWTLARSTSTRYSATLILSRLYSAAAAAAAARDGCSRAMHS